jgi:transcriptional regulator with XRE-family HTH domain
MAQKPSRHKRKILGIRIKPKEGLWITYRLRLMGLKKKDMAARLGVCPQTIEQIINGRGHSTRIETALYQTLGYPSFEAMIAAAQGHEGGAA